MTRRDALDRMDELAAVYRVMADLMIPSADLNIINRDDLAITLDFLNRETAALREHLATPPASHG